MNFNCQIHSCLNLGTFSCTCDNQVIICSVHLPEVHLKQPGNHQPFYIGKNIQHVGLELQNCCKKLHEVKTQIILKGKTMVNSIELLVKNYLDYIINLEKYINEINYLNNFEQSVKALEDIIDINMKNDDTDNFADLTKNYFSLIVKSQEVFPPVTKISEIKKNNEYLKTEIQQLKTKLRLSEKLVQELAAGGVLNTEVLAENYRLIYKGHNSIVTSLAATQSNQFVLSGSSDGSIKMWNLQKKTQESELIGHKKAVKSIAITSDDDLAISASEDSTLIVWDLNSKNQVGTLLGHTSTIWDVLITTDDLYAISCGTDKTIRIWNINAMLQVGLLEGHSHLVRCLAITTNNAFVLSAGGDKTVKLWDWRNLAEIASFNGHSGNIRCITTTNDNNFVISGSEDRKVILWNLSTHTQEYIFIGHTDAVWTVKVLKNNVHLVSGSSDKTFRIWNLVTKNLERLIDYLKETMWSFIITRDYKYCISGNGDYTVRIWNLEGKKKDKLFGEHSCETKYVVDQARNGCNVW